MLNRTTRTRKEPIFQPSGNKGCALYESGPKSVFFMVLPGPCVSARVRLSIHYFEYSVVYIFSVTLFKCFNIPLSFSLDQEMRS
jgi:hypothetical protein